MTLRHELAIELAPNGYRAICTCGWKEKGFRMSQTTALIDAKAHRLDTAIEDDNNTKRGNS